MEKIEESQLEAVKKAPQSPVSFQFTSSELLTHAETLNKDLDQTLNAIIASTDPETVSFAKVIDPFAQFENERATQARWIKFHASTNPDEGIRQASREAARLLDDADAAVFTKRDFFTLVDAVWHQHRVEDLDGESAYYLKKLHQKFEQHGMHIADDDARERFLAIQEKLRKLQREAITNLNNDTSGVWLSPHDLRGLPQDVLKRLETRTLPHPSEDEQPERDAAEGTSVEHRLTMKDPDTIPLMRFAMSAATRERVAHARASRCMQNCEIYKEVFVLRDEAARLLGFEHHAAFRLHYKMTGQLSVVEDFLANFIRQYKDRRDKEIAVLDRLRREHLGVDDDNPDPSLTTTDRAYFERVLQERELQIDQVKIAEYFPLNRTFREMARMFEHLFGVRFVEARPRPNQVWHHSVSLYEIWDCDKSEDFLGYVYLDLYPRNGKYTHAGHYMLAPGYRKKDGGRHYPSAALVMNFPPPTAKKPSLLKHADLRRLFHELGHAMHNVLSLTKYATSHGTLVDTDFVEAPSMMFEHFLWLPQHMRDISCHYSYLSDEAYASWVASQGKEPDADLTRPPKLLPEALIQNLVKSRNANQALVNMVKAWHSTFDLRVHSPKTPAEIKTMDFSSVYCNLYSEIVGLGGMDPDSPIGHGWSSFRAIMGKYDAGYYTYILAQIYSADLFYTGFKDHTTDAERGRRYRYLVLQPGGSQPELETLRNFLGRDANTDAFAQEHGLTV